MKTPNMLTTRRRLPTEADRAPVAPIPKFGAVAGHRGQPVERSREPNAFDVVNPRPFGQRQPPQKPLFPAGFGRSSEQALADQLIGSPKAGVVGFETGFKFTSCFAGGSPTADLRAPVTSRGAPGAVSFGNMEVLFFGGDHGGTASRRGEGGSLSRMLKATTFELDATPPSSERHGSIALLRQGRDNVAAASSWVTAKTTHDEEEATTPLVLEVRIAYSQSGQLLKLGERHSLTTFVG